jgi:two-component system, chemotaxis family, chemotaxis protein CheY
VNKTPTVPTRWSALVIEPDRARAAMLVDLLRDLGCVDSPVVRDGEAGMAQLAVRRPRIVLCAARGAGLDGFEFARRLRRADNVRDPETSTVLTFSGIDRTDILSSLNAGADAVLSFPMSRAQLGGMLKLLDTQKRAFVRSATYVGPCRRRGLVSEEGGRRLEDFGAADSLAAMMLLLKALFEIAQRKAVSSEAIDGAAGSLAVFLRAARPDRQIDDSALHAQCVALVRQFSDHAPGQPSFDHAFSPLRKLLVNVVLKGAKKAEQVAA